MLFSTLRTTREHLLRVAQPDDCHETVWNLLGDRKDRIRDFVFRWTENLDEVLIQIVSPRVPEDPEGVFDIKILPYTPDIELGDVFRFKLLVRPNITKGSDAWKMPPATRGIHWFSQRERMDGFELRHIESATPGVFHLERRGRRDVHFHTVDLEGVLKVSDAEKFRNALLTGIGGGKPYGCGLLLAIRE